MTYLEENQTLNLERKINMERLQVIEKNNERVLLTSQIAESYGTDVRTISNNFNRNKERYTEGKHFYCLVGDELKEFKTIHQNDEQFKHVSVIYLWTEKGALLHAKSLGTDKAWEVYDYLVESYFQKTEKVTLDMKSALLNPDTIIQLATAIKEEQSKSKLLEVKVSELTVDKQIMQPKADYFDELVDRNLLTGIRDTANELGIGQKKFVNFLLDKKFMYCSKKGNLKAYANHIRDGLFENVECYNEKSTWKGTQYMITPKGRETFRLLTQGL